MSLSVHQPYIRRCIELSRQAVANGNHPFACLLVKDGQIVMEQLNQVVETNDPTAHPEISIVRRAHVEHGSAWLAACTLYTNGEPCAMCAGAMYFSSLLRVVYGFSHQRLAEVSAKRLILGPVKFSHGARVN